MLGYSIGGLIGGPILGIIGTREGSMIFGLVCSVAFFMCGLVDNIYFILGMIFVAMFCLGVVYLAAPTIIGRYFLKKKTFANQLRLKMFKIIFSARNQQNCFFRFPF